jgi:DNA invertase Pin-like site-specific DNA recombinase
LARYVAYYRVRSGPGKDRNIALSAQREAVKSFVAGNSELVEEFTEEETLQHRRRPHFEEALKSARRHHATLVIPRFRAIRRTAAFVDGLREAGVDFVALDMPAANPATIATLAADAAQHRRGVAERIRASLQAAKASGKRLGNPKISVVRAKGVQIASDLAQEKRQAVRVEVVELRANGRSLRAIADDLNRKGIPTTRGREWHASSVRKILAEAGDLIS